MSRYDKTKKSQEYKKRKRHFLTTIYQDVPEKNTDMYFISQEGDRCDNLAFRFYGDSSLWWFIARINHLNTMNIPAGTELRIPISLEKAIGL